jgi:arylsulfatase A-like enzyme
MSPRFYRPVRRIFPAIAFVAFVCSLPAAFAGIPAPRYNLIVIVTDDQARWSIGAYGNREALTPNMDRLIREGAKFTQAFATTPVCSPSRVSLLTGLYGTQVGITDWISPEDAQAGVGLPESATTWPEVLQRHGYRTALIGKWHLGEQPQFHPDRHGFDRFYGFLHGEHLPVDPIIEVDGKLRQVRGYLANLLTDEALRFVEDNRNRPFAMLVHFNAPHRPYGPVPKVDSAPFERLLPTVPSAPSLSIKQLRRMYRKYYASVHSIDRNIGRLLERLEQLKLDGKTILVLTSDHGYNIGQHGLYGKGNGTGMTVRGVNGPRVPNMFDTSIAIPLAVRWPGVTRAGSEIGELVGNLDLFASVLGMLDIPLPEGAPPASRDFSPLLRGTKPADWRDAVFGQYDLHNGGLAYLRMIRTGQYKLVRHYFATRLDELYDLRSDPNETDNLYDDPGYRKTRDQLQERLNTWMRSIGDLVAGDAEPAELGLAH